MKLNEFVNMKDYPSELIVVGFDIIKEMIRRKLEVDTDAFLYCYRTQMGNLSGISAERALTRDWEKHPMFGIGSPKCADEWARAYQKTLKISDDIFDILLKRCK